MASTPGASAVMAGNELREEETHQSTDFTTTSRDTEQDFLPENDDEYPPINFFVGHHESNRPLPVSQFVLSVAADVGYDMLTSPITTPHFQSRVLALVSNHFLDLMLLDGNEKESILPPAPIIPPLDPFDTPLTPGDAVSQLIGYCSPWIDLCSPDPVVANISRQVLNMEIAYASFCGIANVIVPAPRSVRSAASDSQSLAQYARAIQEALTICGYLNISIHMPMYGQSDRKEIVGDLLPLAREHVVRSETLQLVGEVDLYEAWDAWNLIRTVCKYNSRLSVALALPRQLPVESLQSRWFAEPLRLLSFAASTFLKNKGNYPVLSKGHQELISRYMRLKQPPWLLLCEVGPIAGLEELGNNNPSASIVSDASGSDSHSPTPAEAAEKAAGKKQSKTKQRDGAAHLVYIRHLQRNQPSRTALERFGTGYQDYLQAPLQPLTDNLESVTYEVFEKDPIKYDWYERAITLALAEWNKPTSSPTGAVVIAVAGSGRGPLVTRALRASATTGVPVEVWAVEKNPNAYVLLQRHNRVSWGGVVNVVKSDMRAWKGPLRSSPAPKNNITTPGAPIGHAVTTPPATLQSEARSQTPASTYGKVDIIVSELLGSFADNELSPECLDGVQHVLAPHTGISIPASYTAHMTPILAPRLHADISARASTDPTATDTPYVVMLHAVDFAAALRVPDAPRFQCAWEFAHPLPASTLAAAEARRAGGVSGGGGGAMAGGDGANEHNARHASLRYVCPNRGVVNGIAGYFEAVLYDGGDKTSQGKQTGAAQSLVELSTVPDTIDYKSKDMISWFPIYFPLKTPLYYPDDTELQVSMWRQTDDRKVWYEWLVEAYVVLGTSRRVRVGVSDLGSSRKVGCLM